MIGVCILAIIGGIFNLYVSMGRAIGESENEFRDTLIVNFATGAILVGGFCGQVVGVGWFIGMILVVPTALSGAFPFFGAVAGFVIGIICARLIHGYLLKGIEKLTGVS